MELTLMGFKDFIPLIIIWLIWRAIKNKTTPPADLPSQAPPPRPVPPAAPETLFEPADTALEMDEDDPFALFRHPREIRDPEKLLKKEKARFVRTLARKVPAIPQEVMPAEPVPASPELPEQPRERARRPIPCGRRQATVPNLQQAVIWAEILAPPVALRK